MDITQWLREYAERSDKFSQDCIMLFAAAIEIEKLREIVWRYVDPSDLPPRFNPIIERCLQK